MKMCALLTSEPWTTNIKLTSRTPVIIIYMFALYMHTCIIRTRMRVYTCACDCFQSLIMTFQGLKHGSFNNTDYWELSIHIVSLLVNL
jgi:hypothetical protein